MKKAYIWILGIIIISAISVYLKNDGLYILGKINTTEMNLINKYTIQFPETTIIESFVLKEDIGSSFFSHNEYIKATLLVPSDTIDSLFPEQLREYNEKHTLDLSYGKTDEIFRFGVWMPKTVVKWFDKTQRTINFTIMQSDNQYTRVYIFVDKLGWNIHN